MQSDQRLEIGRYKGREQTFVKHFFLQRYLETVAYHIGYSYASTGFVYVDGYSGPWKSADEELSDTSFKIALGKLREVKLSLQRHHRSPRIRCVFIERNRQRFQELEKAVASESDLECVALNGDFMDLLPSITGIIGKAFSLTFIDPTNWDIPLARMTPILKKTPGEVIINFMYDYINRFSGVRLQRLERSFDDLFGGPAWRGIPRDERWEDAIVSHYCQRLKEVGGFTYATYTPILKPTQDRPYFHLVYATRHAKGIFEFRRVERSTKRTEGAAREDAKRDKRIGRTQNLEFEFEPLPGDYVPDEIVGGLRRRRLELARLQFLELFQRMGEVEYEELAATIMQYPFIWESDVKDWIHYYRNKGMLAVEGLAPRERTPKPGCIIRQLGGAPST